MKQLALILGIFTLLLVSLSNAQQKWERNYGGADYDEGFSVQQTTDGGYIVAGQSYSFGYGSQVYLIKTNASGDTLWTRAYGGAGGDFGYSVQQTTDGGYIVAGYTRSFGNDAQIYLIKTDASGDTLWTRNYGGAFGDGGRSVQQTSDGGYIVVGVYSIEVYLIKTNPSGDTLWSRIFGGSGWDEGWSVQQTSDTGYIVAGYTSSFGNGYQVYLIKTNATGDTIWTRTYGGAGNDVSYSVQQTSDGGYIIAGFTDSFGNAQQVYLVKTNSLGDTLWTRIYGGARGDFGRSVQQTQDGGYIVAGYTWSVGDSQEVYLIKTDVSGDTLWTRNYGGAGYEEGRFVRQAFDKGYIVAGYTQSFGSARQVYLIKTDSIGSSTGVEENKGFEGPRVQGIKITPNPFTSFATLPGREGERFSLYDVSGRKVGTFRGDRVGEGLAPGVYFLRSSDGKDKPLRIVKVR